MTMLRSILSWTTYYNIVPNDIISLFVQYVTPQLSMDAVLATIVNGFELRLQLVDIKQLITLSIYSFKLNYSRQYCY